MEIVEKEELIEVLDELEKRIQEKSKKEKIIYILDDMQDCLYRHSDDMKTFEHFKEELKNL